MKEQAPCAAVSILQPKKLFSPQLLQVKTQQKSKLPTSLFYASITRIAEVLLNSLLFHFL
jgi:hypothetical protein